VKVIAINRDGNYIAEVSHRELEQLTDKYFGHLPKLKEGSEFDLGEGYGFRSDIVRACEKMGEAKESFEEVQQRLFDFCKMVSARFGETNEIHSRK
jgi:hypothetical protein